MSFLLESRDASISFPCSICKKNTQSANICKKTCRLYELSSIESFDLKNDVQKLISNYLLFNNE
jgi:hypothetical protein